MKPCEFPGWLEVEIGDPIAKDDIWARRGFPPDDDPVADWRIGIPLKANDLDGRYRLFRRQENAPAVVRKRVYQPRCKPLPLP